jgi:dipeptidyl aminopeptidase/acylaminoacyl peptidase
MSVAMAAEHLELHKLRFSDDGSLISFENDGQSYECRIASARCSRHPSAGTELELSPDGRRGIFARDANLWVRDLTTGREQQLTSDGQADNGYGIYPDGWKADFIPRAKSQVPLAPWHVQWSPDSTKVLVPHLDQRHVKTYPFIEYAPDDSFRPNVYNVHLPLVGEKPADLTWFVLDTIKGTKVRIEFPYEKFLPLQQDLVSLRRAIWSDDGKRLYSVVFGDELKESFLFETDLGTGKTRTVIQERGEPHANLNSTSYNPPNVQLANDAVDVVWYSERDGWGHLYLYDGRTGALKRQLTKGDWLVRDIIKVDGARRLIYFSGAGREGGDPYYRYIYRVNFDGSDLKLLTPQALDHLITGEENDVLSLDGATGYQVVAPSGRFFVYNASALDKVPEASIRRTTDGGLVATFQKADASKLFAAGYQPPVSVMLRAASGNEPIYGALYKPANLDPKKRYPIIDTQYVSPLTAVVPHNFMAALDSAGPLEPSSLVQHGFAAVVMDARGTTYRSRAFSEGMFGRLDTMNLEDHVVGIKQLAQTYSWIDADRVGISGASYGGWTALRGLLTQPDFFKVGVASVPAGTFHTLYLDYHWTAFQGKPVYKGGSLLRPTPLDIPKNWEKLNSDAEVGELKGKLLMIIGGLDENVPAGSPMRFFRKAAAAGKDVSLIYMPSASHSSAIDPYSWQKTLRFLQEGLGGAE